MASPQDHLPLRSVDFLILLMLAPKERHGYGIMQDVLEHTGGRIELEAGSLYRTIRRLGAEGTARRIGPPTRGGPRRRTARYYRLTPLGRRVVAAEAARLRNLVRIAESARLLDPLPSR